MIQPRHAPVRPRVRSPQSGETLLLQDEVHPFLAAGAKGVIAVLGPGGSGKSTALRHLAAVLNAGSDVAFLDEPTHVEVFGARADHHLIVYAATRAREGFRHLALYSLAPWDNDDLIEYLLAVHKTRCASVMARVRPEDHLLFQGIPDLWHIVLERLADEPALGDARSALHRYLEAQLPDTDLLERVRSACLNVAVTEPGGAVASLERLAKPGFGGALLRALRHPAVQMLLAAERIGADLRWDADCDFLAKRLPRELVRTAAVEVRGEERAIEHLHRLLAGPAWSHAMAASLLHATGTGWVPPPGGKHELAGAYLDGARWPGAQLAGANLQMADLSAADLRGADLSDVRAVEADLSHALLQGVVLMRIDARGANLQGAGLSSARALGARFERANLEGANLEDAMFRFARFTEANLTAANLRGADLKEARFMDRSNDGDAVLTAEIREADFSGADLRGAVLSGMKLRQANFRGADFAGAYLNECDLEYVDLPGANFDGAGLTRALLTGSTMTGACFRNAHLTEAGLADVNWEGADLRGADLSRVTFHLGSSRNGLVFSPYACEGSKTGFYTDDYDEQSYKAPEEIRKANLCGADLRGARLDGVDFYLVDLRGAQYDPEVEAHLRRCGAILEARV
jgi:uncharacterized protein YjbI with pentapeptide repeats